ncbi:MAG: aminotransferase class I/II-fold pyridoxal phosphate-dependent enzyme [Victivallaceae bacterium]|nr:aminotransferase class I/II-fold pyridoxal phosphate-dependent enzyme [Victivallaceae bacterium]
MSVSRSARSKNRVAKHLLQLKPSGIRRFFELVNSMDGVISLGIGEPDFVTPWTIRESGIFSIEHGHTSYTSNAGIPALRKAICEYVSSDYGVDYDYNVECLVTVGVSEALDIAIRAITNPGDEIIYTSPCFVSYPAEIIMANGTPVPLVTDVSDGFALNPDKLRKLITPRTRALLLNFPCNPTGAVMTREQLMEVAAIAKKHDLIVITDEIYSELTYDGVHVSIASLPGMRERTIFLHGFSKAFAMTGWRVGYACAPIDIISTMAKLHQYSIMCAATVAQEAALEALKNGRYAVDEMRNSYRERRDILVAGFNSMGMDCIIPHGAFYAFPSIARFGMDSETFATELLRREKVAVVPGSAFGGGGEGFVRCCYATAMDELQEALVRIKRFLTSL